MRFRFFFVSSFYQTHRLVSMIDLLIIIMHDMKKIQSKTKKKKKSLNLLEFDLRKTNTNTNK